MRWCSVLLLLASCRSQPVFDPVGGFEISPSPAREAWSELELEALRAELETAQAALASLPAYRATLETRERIGDELFPRRVMHVKLAEAPFRVTVETSAPASEAGQRVWFDERKNDGELVAETPGFLGKLVGHVSLDPEGDLAMENRRHPLTDIGLVRLLEQVEESLDPALSRRQPPRVRGVECELGGEPVRLLEALVDGEAPDPALLYRLAFARDSRLLVYTGIAQLFPEGPALLEEYLYRDVVAAPELTDADFEPER
jgi:hypothetical protein